MLNPGALGSSIDVGGRGCAKATLQLVHGWAYIAVGMAAPILFAFTGDRGFYDVGRSQAPTGDADFDTWTLLFINALWFGLSHFPATTCAEEYGPAPTNFDVGVMSWAAISMLPLLLYPWRAAAPRIWSRFGCSYSGSAYRGLACLSGILVAQFLVREAMLGFAANTAFVSSLTPALRNQYDMNYLGAFVDFLAFAATMAVFVYRNARRRNLRLGLVVFLCMPVGWCLFLAQQSEAEKSTPSKKATPRKHDLTMTAKKAPLARLRSGSRTYGLDS